MARVLVVAPDHTAADRTVHANVTRWITDAGHQAARLPTDSPDKILLTLRNALQSCDACVAILEGEPVDAALAWTLALAYGSRRPILGLRSDSRASLPVALQATLSDVVKVKSWDDEEAKAAVTSFLGNVKVFAGALVRDAVPKMLREQGQEMKFRQVAESEYPRVLKRKLVETAQRLEESDFGVEQEEIADVLELLETLINLRKYDKESLRSIKEGKWRKRGGFQKGYLLEEEPVISSR